MTKEKETGEFELVETNRGFLRSEFTDLYGLKCSLQESSLATEYAIWFGVNDASLQVMASDAIKLGIKTKETTGWIDYPLPDEVMKSARMHLSQEMVIALLPSLEHFAKTGELPIADKTKSPAD